MRPTEPKFDRTAKTARLINIDNASLDKANVVSSDNRKLGQEIPASNLRPVRDCTNCKFCAKDCYAMKAWKIYPSVRVSLTRNSALLRTDIGGYFEKVHRFLTKKSPDFFRIHSSGDFISLEHLKYWVKIAKNHPKTKFLAFTKSYEIVSQYLTVAKDWPDFEIPENFSLVVSVFPGMVVPKDLEHLPRAYAGEPEDYKHLARASDALHCPGSCQTCQACWGLAKRNIDVRFSIH
ncbi:MAG: GP88 family protein [Planctomycetota bacterium]|jgi:ferredoxin